MQADDDDELDEDHPLQTLLRPYRSQTLRTFGGTAFFHDAPPDVARQALALLDDVFTTSRPNDQPPAGWLVDVADRWGGTVGGTVSTGWGGDRLRLDAVCVPGEHSRALVDAVARDWPERRAGQAALSLALAMEWDGWDAERPRWEGPASDLLSRPPASVVGLWWD